MQFNDVANSLGICQSADFKVNTNSSTYPVAQKTRSANTRQSIIWSWIFQAFGGWLFVDSNQLGLPETKQTLTTNTSDYALPALTMAIIGVEILDLGNVWHKLIPITEEQIQEFSALGEFQRTAGIPRYYLLKGDKVRVYPAPNYTQATSLNVIYDSGSVAFTASDTTKVPGFAVEFHEALAVGMALDYATANKPEMVGVLTSQWLDYEKRIKEYYSRRWKEMKPAHIGVKDIVRDYE